MVGYLREWNHDSRVDHHEITEIKFFVAKKGEEKEKKRKGEKEVGIVRGGDICL